VDPNPPGPNEPPAGPPTEPWTPPGDDDIGSLVDSPTDPGAGTADRPTVVAPPATPPGGTPTAAMPPGGAPPAGGSSAPTETPKKPNVALRYAVAIFGVIALVAALIGGYYWGKASQQNDKLQSQLDKANAQVDDLTAQVDELNAKVDDLTAKNKDLNTQVKDLKAQVKDLQNQNDQLTEQNQQLQPLVGGDPTAGAVGVGQPLLIGGTNGAQLNVTVAAAVDPAPGLTPAAGNRIVGITLTVVNVGSAAYDDPQFGTGAKLSAGGQVFGPALGDGSLTSLSLGAGATGSGTVLFEIPEPAGLTSFSLTLNGGTGPQTGSWNLS
jgi:outer membrane murein-binding lipoprotein Lpp